jgi:hypothetical protein
MIAAVYAHLTTTNRQRQELARLLNLFGQSRTIFLPKVEGRGNLAVD